MKKLSLILMILVFTITSGWTQRKDFKEICEKYKHFNSVESFEVNGLGCFIASFFVGGEENSVKKLIRNSSSCQILVCDGKEKRELLQEIIFFIRSNKLEELTGIKDQGEQVKIYIEGKKDLIRQFFLMVVGKEELVFLQIKGEFSKTLLRKLMKTMA